MSVRFVIGRAGTGKTAHCINAIAESLRNAPLTGPHLILLVPEQAGLQMERALLSQPGVTAIHRAEVFGFRRLAYRILASCPQAERSAITPAARAMMLRLLMTRHAAQLRYYKRPERFAGTVEQLGRTISELIEEAVVPEDILPPEPGGADPIRAAKLHDIHLLYQAYLSALGDHRLDPSQFLDVARAKVVDCDWLRGAHLWVDGFAGFSRQERLMLAELARVAQHMDITALMDPDDYAAAGRLAPPPSTALFATTRRMIATLCNIFDDQGLTLDQPLQLRNAPRRFEASPELAAIEQHLFTSSPSDTSPTTAVRLIEAADRRTEVEYAVSQVLRYVQRPTNPLRYRDIALIVRDLEPYDALISAALRSRGIPFFLDRRRPTAHHPLVSMLRSLIELAATDYAGDPVRQLLKTGLLDLTEESADELENHLLATGVTGRERWTAQDWSPPARTQDPESEQVQAAMQRVNNARKRFVELVDPFVTRAPHMARRNTDVASPLVGDEPRPTGQTWAEIITAALTDMNIEDRIEQWAKLAEQDGDLDLGEAHRQTWRDCLAVIDDLTETLGDEPLTIEDLSSIIDSALGQLTLGLAPPMLDQVLVGSVERSRHPEIKLAVLLGFNDGLFPAVPVESVILNDDDRAWLAHQGVTLGTPRTQRILEEKLLAYVAMTRPSEALLVTYPAADEDGKELRPSPFVTDLMAATGIAEPQCISDPFRTRQNWSVNASRDLAAQLACEFRHRPDQPNDDTDLQIRATWNALYEHTRADRELQPALRHPLSALRFENTASLTEHSAQHLITDPLRTSVSRLETFAACHFKHFAQHGLDLRERQQSHLEAVDIGSVHHKILEEFFEDLHRRGKSIVDLDESGVAELIEESHHRVGETIPLLGQLSNARDRYIVARSRRELFRVLNAQKRIASGGSFRSKATELPFGFSQSGSLPAFELTTPGGRHVVLRGYIDRVDLAEVADDLLGIVVDYKRTRNKRLDLSSAFHGLSLQLLAYLLVLAERGQTLTGRPIKPAGAFYVSLRNDYTLVEHPDDAATDRGKTGLRPRGIMSTTALPALEGEHDNHGWSPNFAVFRTKAGGIGHLDQSDVAESDSFSNLLDHTRRQIALLADQVFEGVIDVSPYRLGYSSPCSWCPFSAVCRIDPPHTRFRFLETLTRSDVFRRISAARSEASDA